MVSVLLKEVREDLLGRPEPVVEMAGGTGSGICTHVTLLRRGRQDRSSQRLERGGSQG
jgi:hypothetical protein